MRKFILLSFGMMLMMTHAIAGNYHQSDYIATASGSSYITPGTAYDPPPDTPPDQPPGSALPHTLTVNNGSGSGSYIIETKIPIVANPAPSGQVFDQWTGDISGVADSTAASTIFTMGKDDATITATYMVPPVLYSVTVNGGTGATGSGSYAEGKTVNISAGTPPANQQFKNWTTSSAGVNFANADNSSTSFTMPANAVTVTAKFEAIPDVVNAQTPIIASQPQSATVAVGDAVNLSVTASVTDGGTLSYQWYKETSAINGATGSTFSPSTATGGTASYYVVVTNTNNSVNGTKTAAIKSGSATVIVNATPVKTYTLTVNSGSGGGNYATGAQVPIIADAAPNGKVFDQWTGDISGIANANAASTTYTIGSVNATITATYKDLPPNTYTVTFTVNVPDAVITLNGVTNPAGDYVFSGLEAGTYTYTITREGYPDLTGTIVVSGQGQDITVIVNMPTGIENIKTGTKVYIENSSIRIESVVAIKIVEIYNIIGQRIRQVRVNTNQVRIDNLPSGIIIVKISLQGAKPEVRKIYMK